MSKTLQLEDIAKILIGGSQKDEIMTSNWTANMQMLFNPETQVEAVNYLKKKSVQPRTLTRMCIIVRTSLYRNITIIVMFLYLLALMRIK